jgi:formylglycine-generating enzyme required for sulfatase activity
LDVKVGNYEILDDLKLTEHGAVSRACRRDDPEAIFAVKRFGGAVEDPSEPRWELQTFLDRVRVQQAFAGGADGDDAPHWAPIYEQGMDGDWAYYVTDYLPLSAQKLIDARVNINSNDLYAIACGVVDGLGELKAAKDRAHGNLKPSNVLIGGTNLSQAAILLTDPASNVHAAKAGETSDVRALAEMIHQLVMHRLPREGEWPFEDFAAWDRLGGRGDRWRRICCELFDPTAPPLNLSDLKKRLDPLRPRRQLAFTKILVTLAIPVMMIAIAVGTLSMLDHSARVQFRDAKREWFGKFYESAADPARRRRWERDPDLKRILAELPIEKLRQVDSRTDPAIRWNYYDYVAVADANRVVQAIEDDLPAKFAVAARAAELRGRLQERDWSHPVWYLSKLIDGVTPAPNVDVAAGIDRLLAAAPNIESGLALADSDWKKFMDRINAIQAVRDPVLSALATGLVKSATSQVRLTDAGFAGLAEVKKDGLLAQNLFDAIQNVWPTYIDRENFDREIAKAIDLNHPRRQDADTWLTLLAANSLRREERAAAAADLRKALSDTLDLINHSKISPAESDAYESATQAARMAIAGFDQVPFTRRMLDDGTLARKRDEVRNRIEGLRRFFHPELPEDWLNALAGVATASNRINEFWEAWRKVLRDGLPDMVKDHNLFVERQQASEQMRALLVALDQDFPPAPPFPNEAFMAAARLRREQAIGRLLPLIDLHAPKLDPDVVKSARADFGQWTANLVELSRDFPITREILGPADQFDKIWKAEKPEFWNDPAVQALIKDDVARLNRLNVLDGASRKDLVAAMTGATEAEIGIKAWRLLGADSIRPPWPTEPGELTVELKFRQLLSKSFNALKDPAEANEASKELAAQAPIRWRRVVEYATSEETLQDAWKFREVFAGDPRMIAKLPPLARYNLYLSCMHTAIALGDAEGVGAAMSGLSEAAAGMIDRPAMASLAARAGRIGMKEPFADKNPADLFDLTLPGVANPLQFKRVEPARNRPFYLCTTAISAGQFAAVLDAAGAWSQAKVLPWPYLATKPDTRRGPRTWEWGTPIAMTTPLLWLTPDEYNDYPPLLRAGRFNRTSLSEQVGGNPSPDHPMQYVSAQVALYFAGVCGCRLPAPAEWQAAYDAFEKNVSIERWNLRDQTWDMQRAYAAQSGNNRWPDEGIFPAVVGPSFTGRNATSRPEKDGALFFQPVNGSGAVIFRHLVGNVAQFICDKPEAFDDWTDKKTAAGIRKFIEQAPRSIFVIGGSALSPPQAPFDKPLAVEHTDEAYADVGFRLAFTAPSRTLAEKVKWAIGDPLFIWPEKPAATQASKSE